MSDIEIARAANKKPIQEIGSRLGIPTEHLLPFGHDKAKVSEDFIKSLSGRKDGHLILVTAINPTPAGEGKTTTTVGLGDGLNAIGKNAAICIREASLGPCFGMKGGAAGGGYAQVVPMEEMNLHFTGDFHAITSAHNLLAAMLDNHIYWGNELDIDIRRVAYRRDRSPVFARDIKADGAMTVLLQQAMQPNIVQTLENNPAFVHGGPFANIAHGCNSVVATTTALKLADYVVTEAGFGADLGAEKFMNIKCRKAGLSPKAVVLVATVRAMKMNGGVGKADLGGENVGAVKKGCANLGRHIENLKQFGVPVVVAINHFVTDTDAEVAAIRDYAKSQDSEAILCQHWAKGSDGTKGLAQRVVEIIDEGGANFAPLYPDEMPLFEKIETIAKRIYRADEVVADTKIRDQLKSWEKQGYGHLPVCMAKTQYSFTTDPTRRGAPTGHSLPVREVRLSAGAGFIVVICGEIMTMPGLPRVPSAESICINDAGLIDGLF